MDTLHLLQTLTAAPGISGCEDAAARTMAELIRPHVDDVQIDSMANVIARIGPEGGPALAICAHLDTIGFLVKRQAAPPADDTLRVVTVGGINLKAAPGTLVQVHTTGGAIAGMIGVRSQHQAALLPDGIPSMEDLYLHVPPQSGIPVGSMVTYAPQWQRIGQCVVSPYLDDRAGVALLIALAERLRAAPLPFTLYLIGTTQEETTCQGARVALRALQPQAAIFVDGTVCYDTPETSRFGEVRTGAGPVLTQFLYIRGLAAWHAHPRLWAHLRDQAQALDIAFQTDVVHGLMADSLAAADLGIPSAVVGLPMRSKHAPLEMLDLRDFDAALELLARVSTTALPSLARG